MNLKKEKEKFSTTEVPETIAITNKVGRKYNLGGFNNTLEIEMSISGPANEVKNNFDNIVFMNAHITRRLGDTIMKVRKKIRLDTGEEYEADGGVVDKKDEDE